MIELSIKNSILQQKTFISDNPDNLDRDVNAFCQTTPAYEIHSIDKTTARVIYWALPKKEA